MSNTADMAVVDLVSKSINMVARRGDITQYMVQMMAVVLNFEPQARLGIEVDILDTGAAAVVADD